MKLSLKAPFSQIEPSERELKATKACIRNENQMTELDNKIVELERIIRREKR